MSRRTCGPPRGRLPTAGYRVTRCRSIHCGPHGKQPEGQSHHRDRGGAWRRRGQRPADPGRRGQQDEGAERPRSHAVAGPRRAQVDRHAGREEDALHEQRQRDRVPQAETDLRPAGPERQVGPVHEEVEYPVAQHHEADDQPGAGVFQDGRGHAAHRNGPHERHAETVAPRVVVEGERRERGVAGIDADHFDPGEQQHRPDQIERKCGTDKRAERRARFDPFGGERDGKMAHEHRPTREGRAAWSS